MAGYAKLFSSIVDSTIWRAEMHVKVVWITMLAKADKVGIVQASVPGLADAARVSLPQCIEALHLLGSPDKWSRTKDFEGRRIMEIDGGWVLLNYEKYRAIKDEEKIREDSRLRVRAYRKREKENVTLCNEMKHEVTQSNDIAEAEAEAEAEQTSPLPPKGKSKVMTRKEKKAAKLGAFREDVVQLVQFLIPLWPVSREDGGKVINDDVAACGAVTRILDEFSDLTPGILREAALSWLSLRVPYPNGIQYFFGPGKPPKPPPWKSEAMAILTKDQNKFQPCLEEAHAPSTT